VPPNWQAVAYPSLKPLASWVKDLGARVEFMRDWLKHGHPLSYWLSGFFFPHGFMTGTLQTYARRHLKPIDQLQFKFKILKADNPISITKAPAVIICLFNSLGWNLCVWSFYRRSKMVRKFTPRVSPRGDDQCDAFDSFPT